MTAVTTWLDRLLGRVTMYALVLLLLGALAVVAAALGLLGWFAFGPIDIAVSAAVLMLAAVLANRVAGAIVGIRPQTSSALITALLLLFIFPPSLDPVRLGIFALAAVIAVASKYLIAVRGRHIFNPAAVGAFVISVVPFFATQQVFALWWLGTPIMLPFVAVAAFLVLYRTRKLQLAGVFLVAAVAVMILYAALSGLPVADALYGAVLSSPIVFFAGFMLSEPLTLPPRRWQQLLEAAVVGLLFVPFHIGILSSSPQLALLVGNLLAFWFGQRRGIRLSYVGKTQLAPTSWEFEFRPAHPVRFTPGQYMELTLPHAKTDSRGWRRVFSIASAPGDGSSVRFGIRLPDPSSAFKRALLALEPGAKVTATSVGGDFVLPRDGSRLLLVAGGIGITPYVAQLEQLAAEGSERDIALVYAIRNADDLAYADRLATTPCSVTVVAPAKPAQLPRGWRWVQSERLTGEQLLAAVPDASQRHTYLSGSPEWVGGLKRALRAAGAKRIHTDVFVGY